MSRIQVTDDVKRQMEATGSALNGISGGPRKQRYWTPTGAVVYGIPAIRDYVVKDDDGKVIEQGTRDANFDKGWLPSPPPPNMLKLVCANCGKWHDTEAQIDACGTRRRAHEAKMEAWAKKQMNKGQDLDGNAIQQATGELAEKVDSLAEMVGQLTQIVGALATKEDPEMGKLFNETVRDREGVRLGGKKQVFHPDGPAPTPIKYDDDGLPILPEEVLAVPVVESPPMTDEIRARMDENGLDTGEAGAETPEEFVARMTALEEAEEAENG